MTTLKPIETATNQDIQIKTREVYVVRGSGKTYLSEKGALNKLAYVRAQKQFNKEDRPSNFPTQKVIQEDGTSALRDGKMRPEFIERHAQVLEELKIRIRLEKEIIQLRKKTREARDKLLKAVDDLEIAQKKHNNLK
ncbi:hypothetical protein [Xenorhabdus bovienii]|uniref:hypothetical protein n=1 Tax=Xenorhabdus bovienii TaxID=40576 RepID=UPI0023B2899A|nr:hypothetical protein [Xenorhabdus bovienii]MDE9431390.1 hypothetical protein [Xenorhabdus bovienii]MDE9489172.1 hypothetical protein [Xenorhabdus bovienii]MDE9505382.1 hypothetical protein [Xenorhabdus bovienii]MDE9549391.1 hypothetical protein [Xenorhabdus bovienii]